MYKVFINDKPLCFISHSSGIEPSFIIRENDPAYIPGLMLTYDFPRGKSLYHVSDDAEKSFNAFIQYFPLIEAAGGLVRKNHKDGAVLMIYRLGYWDLPKGKIDKGEETRETAVREVSEECGVTGLDIIRPVDPGYHMYMEKNRWVVKKTYWFEMICSDNTPPTPQTNENITEVKWVPVNEIRNLLPLCYALIEGILLKEISGV